MLPLFQSLPDPFYMAGTAIDYAHTERLLHNYGISTAKVVAVM